MPFALSDMQLTSAAFAHGAAIPKYYVKNGENVSPPLAWQHPPAAAQGYAVICHDPDAPLVKDARYGFVHWVLYNLPAATHTLEEGSSAGTAGVNDFGDSGYGGPQPPAGHGTHHYFFWVLALDRALALPAGLTLWQFLERAESHVIAMNRLLGTYRID
jgi:hypothetical protein